MIDHPWDMDENGFWCTSCGDRVAGFDDDEATLPEHCRQCGFPDPEAVAEYHCGDDDDQDDGLDEDGNIPFECAGYYPEPAGEFYCPLWGTEECDWECPHS